MTRLRCGDCGRSRPEEETTLISGTADGNYRRARRRTRRRVCRDCTIRRITYARNGQGEGRNCPLNEAAFQWDQAARDFGLDISGLVIDQWGYRVAP